MLSQAVFKTEILNSNHLNTFCKLKENTAQTQGLKTKAIKK